MGDGQTWVPAVGDTVRIVGESYPGADFIGQVGQVYEVRDDGECRIADGDIDGPLDGWSWAAWVRLDCLAPVTPENGEQDA